MFVLGLDIGYSNLKIAMGHKDEGMTTKVLPAGAGRVELMPRNMSAGMGNDFLQVVINGEKWAAGVEPSRLQGWERELHRDYKSTDVYKALFYAALLVSEQTEIDMLVTGLPVDQAKDEQQRNELIDLLKGAHQITPKLEVTVKDVLVVPQPAGAYMENDYFFQAPFFTRKSSRDSPGIAGPSSLSKSCIPDEMKRFTSCSTDMPSSSDLRSSLSGMVDRSLKRISMVGILITL